MKIVRPTTMIDDTITYLQHAVGAVYDALLWPGHMAISAIAFYSPHAASWLAIDAAEPPLLMAFVLSLILWFMIVVIVTMLGRFVANLVRVVEALARTAWYRISLFVRGIKTTWLLRLRRLALWRRKQDAVDVPTVEFDDLDLAVLRSASLAGPGLAVSAPELAEKFCLRPAQVQRCLKKLSSYRMLDYVIGATDGYDNFRLTDYGAAYVANWQRQNAAT